jgi:large repetitive protein
MKIVRLLSLIILLSGMNTAFAQTPNYVWAKRIGGTDIDDGRSIVVDAAGNSYTAGFFRGTADFDPGPGTSLVASLGQEDIFITKLDAAGNLVWSRRMGGTTNDFCYSIAVDASGNVYTTGQFNGTADFDPGAGTFNMTSAGSWDVWISKLDAAGNFVWAKRFGSTLADNGRTVKTDAAGNVYTIGTFTGTVDFDPGAGTSNLTAPSGQDVFVSKLDAAGNFVWAKSYGGTGTEDGRSIVIDATGNVFIAGSYNLTVDFDPGAGTFNLTSAGAGDVYVLKLNSAGNFVWAVGMGGTLADGNGGMSLDAAGNIQLVGSFNGTADFDPGAGTFNLVSAGSTDIYISKLDPAGNLLWAKRIGGTGADNGNCVTLDASDAVYVGGGFNATVDFDPGAGTFNLVSSAQYDACIAKLDASGNFVWAVRMGGIANDATYSLGYHSSGTIYSTGVFDDVVDFNPGAGTANLTSAGASEVWIQKLCQVAPQPGTISGSTAICSGTTNTYSITPVPTATTYTWTTPAGWTGTSTTNSISTTASLTSGNVTVVANNACGASVVQTLSVTVTPTPTFPTVMTGNTTVCPGSPNTYTIGFVNGATLYTWTYPVGWTGPATSTIPSVATTAGPNSGTISVTASNSCGSAGPRTLAVTVVPGPTSTISSQTNVSCNGGTNGAATVLVSGGTAPYTYSWAPGGGTAATATGLSPNTYTCTITDATGCTGSQTVSITQPTAITSSVSSQTNVSCNGGANGAATVAVSGGVPGYTYSWAPSGGTAATTTGRTANTYTCTITDANGCTRTQTVNITQPTAITSTVSAQTNTSCNGGSNGSATILAGGGAGGYTYAWAPSGGTAATAAGLSAQTYTCTITDANGCTRQQTATITQPTVISSSVSAQTNVSCNGGSTGAATVAVSGGTPGYTYSWAPSGGTAATTTARPAGIYTCTITDANGCTRTQTVNITQPTAITSSISSSTNVTCNGGNNGSATVLAGGGAPGYTYLWAPSGGTAATATGLSANTYTCTITDANACTRQQTVTLTQPAGMTSSVASQTNVSCNGGANGAATLSVSGGTGPYTYAWLPSGGTAISITGRTAGVYTCTITDAGGCTRTQTVNITQPAAITSSISSQTNVSCNGGSNGSATVLAGGGAGGFTYAWAPSGGTAATATGLAANTYTCTITDANSCTRTQTVTIAQPAVLTSSVSAQTNVLCNGGSTGAATVAVSGGTPGYTYSWTPSGGTAATTTARPAGIYTCTITDANGCTRTQTVNITQPTAITSSVSSSTNVTCNGGNNGSATVLAGGGTPGYTYLWAPSGGTAATATGLSAGTYTCTITDANGCTRQQTVTITQPAGMTSSVASQTNVSCNGGANGAATISVSGGTGPYTYAWAPSGGTTASITGRTAGIYTCTITDAGGCTRTQTVNITQPNAITSSVTAQTNVSCNGGNSGAATIAITGGTPGYTYLWAPSGGTAASITGRTAGTYTCTITDANGCTHTQTVNITQPSAIVSSVSSQTNLSCNGGNNGAATVAVSGGTPTYTYSWAPAGGTTSTATGLNAGTYTCTITDANGCTRAQTVTLTQPVAITSSVTSQTNVSCNGGSDGSATINATGGAGGFTYSWAPTGGNTATISGSTAGIFTCTITDANGCAVAQTVNITQPNAITSSVSSQTDVTCNGSSDGSATITAAGGTGLLIYDWTPGNPTGDGTVTVSGLTAQTWTCTITDANMCTHTQTVSITEPGAVTTSVTSQTDPTCNGGNDGTAAISATGGVGNFTYLWSPAGGTAATATGLTAGSYTCVVTDANGCAASELITLNEPAAIASSQTVTLCAGQTFTVGASTYTATGIYTETLSAINGCDSTVTTDLTINPAIDVTISSLTGTLTANQNGATYQWFDCVSGTIIPGATSQSYTPATSGDYAVIITLGQCSDTSACLNVITGIEAVEDITFNVYPNPTNGLVNVQLNTFSPDAQIEVFNATGQLVHAEKALSDIVTITLPEDNGIYLLRITIGGVSSTLRVVKE